MATRLVLAGGRASAGVSLLRVLLFLAALLPSKGSQCLSKGAPLKRRQKHNNTRRWSGPHNTTLKYTRTAWKRAEAPPMGPGRGKGGEGAPGVPLEGR